MKIDGSSRKVVALAKKVVNAMADSDATVQEAQSALRIARTILDHQELLPSEERTNARKVEERPNASEGRGR